VSQKVTIELEILLLDPLLSSDVKARDNTLVAGTFTFFADRRSRIPFTLDLTFSTVDTSRLLGGHKCESELLQGVAMEACYRIVHSVFTSTGIGISFVAFSHTMEGHKP
jgi:hypothetical protein